MLDPHPLNILGHGILTPAHEARLIARGVVFAQQVTGDDGCEYLRTMRRPWADVMAGLRDPSPVVAVRKAAGDGVTVENSYA